MKQVLVAACVGVLTGWMGFGWVLAEAPGEAGFGSSDVVATHSLPMHEDAVRIGTMMEPNLRG